MAKRYTAVFLFLLIFQLGNAQIIPTEIMYNPPESGIDSLEYFEMYNTGNQPIALDGYFFSQGFNMTFGDDTIGANSYFLIAVNDSALFNVLGVVADAEWESNALSNGGEAIELMDADSTIIFSMTYDDADPWPDAPDGEGPSLELCDLEMDYTDPASWGEANTATGAFIDGTEVFGTPGSSNDSDCGNSYDHMIEVSTSVFTPSDLTINIGETVLWQNIDGEHNVDGRQETYPDNPASFYSGPAEMAPWEFTHTFTALGTYDYECTPHAAVGMTGTITVINPNQAPLYDIATVTTNDANGVPDSIGVECRLRGIIYGANRRSGGYEFALIEGMDGITVFSSDEIRGYSAEMGDEVEVQGTISQFNGTTQLNASDITLISEGNPLLAPREVDSLGEHTESEYIGLERVKFVDPSNWDGSGSSFNIEIQNVITGEILTMRIDEDVPLAGLPEPPEGADGSDFGIIGIGGQFDPDEPYFDGYQLFPSFESDFIMLTSTNNIYELNAKVYPNPADKILTVEDLPEHTERIKIYDQLGQLVKTVEPVSPKMVLDINDLVPGTYFIISEIEGNIYYQQWLKQ